MDQNDLKNLPRNDQVVLATGVLALIFSFFPFYGVSVSVAGFSASTSINTWHSYATLGILLVIVATLIAAAQVFAASSMPDLPVSPNVIVAGLSGLGTLLIILRGFTYDSESGPGGSVGLKWAAYVVMALCVIQVIFAVMRVRAAGDPMPWQGRSSEPGAPPPAA